MAFNRYGPIGCPCHECDERHVGCHGECRPYLEWTEKRKKEAEARYAQRESSMTMNRQQLKKYWRNSRYGKQAYGNRIRKER